MNAKSEKSPALSVKEPYQKPLDNLLTLLDPIQGQGQMLALV